MNNKEIKLFSIKFIFIIISDKQILIKLIYLNEKDFSFLFNKHIIYDSLYSNKK